MTDEIVWTKECQEKWQLAHEHVMEKDTTAVATYIMLLLIALQRSQTNHINVGKFVSYLAKRLRQSDSPIYLLAHNPDSVKPKKSKAAEQGRFNLPAVDASGQVTLVAVPYQLFVQLENYAQHTKIVIGEWKNLENHYTALEQSGFLFESTS